MAVRLWAAADVALLAQVRFNLGDEQLGRARHRLRAATHGAAAIVVERVPAVAADVAGEVEAVHTVDDVTGSGEDRKDAL